METGQVQGKPSLLRRLRRSWIESERGAVVDGVALFCAIVILAVVGNAARASQVALPLSHTFHTAYADLGSSISNTHDQITNGQSNGPSLGEFSSAFHGLGVKLHSLGSYLRREITGVTGSSQ